MTEPLTTTTINVLKKACQQETDYATTDTSGQSWKEAARAALQARIDDPTTDFAIQSVNLILVNKRPSDWNRYLFRLGRDWADFFGREGEHFSLYVRQVPNGVKFFDQHWTRQVRCNSLQEFKKTFDGFSKGILSGLGMDNLLIAGGSVLGCLTQATTTGQMYDTSDIDIFIHGLDAPHANDKVRDVETVLLANVPNFTAHYSIERSVSTISFVPKCGGSGYRKIQVILRMFANPGEVLASFDLDQTAVGYDGSEVMVEPRAARALLSGYTFATAKMLRRSAAGRLAKYALRGYGLVIRVGRPHDANGKALALMLATMATAAYDWVANVIEARRRSKQPTMIQHHSVNMAYVVSIARANIPGTWLDDYTGFAMLAAVWDHAAAHDRSMRELAEALLKREGPYASVDHLDYDETSVVTAQLHEQDWDTALASTIPKEGILRSTKEAPAYHVWARTGATTVADVLLRPVVFYVYLPKGLVDALKVLAGSVVRADVFTGVTHCPEVVDMDGQAFELHSWAHQEDNMWQPVGGMERQVYDFLRNAATASAWSVRRSFLGTAWPKLCFNAVTRRFLANMQIPTDVEEDIKFMYEWCRT
ncbi:hypothetical protein CF319_g7626 [Tilletia indica]|nr:hypothetical protein CF319_g7626 [Tilletia indica]